MRLVVWNGNMGLHRKLESFAHDLDPDVAVISECANPEILRDKGADDQLTSGMVWMGRDPNKGLAVLAWNDWKVNLAVQADHQIEWVAPVEVDGPIAFRLLAVWAMHKRARRPLPKAHWLESLAALDVYREWYADRPLVFAGDFNANVVWDRPRATSRNHSNTIRGCEDAGLVSAYHAWTGESHGEESAPTLYWRDRTETGPSYHIDYAFVPRSWLPAVTNLHVGRFCDWVGAKRSDHVPLVIDFDIARIDPGPETCGRREALTPAGLVRDGTSIVSQADPTR
jgi:hypothetical protein